MHAVGQPHLQHLRVAEACYLLQEGYVDTFQELLETTDWKAYGRESGNPKCQQCMVHCGHEPTAVDHTFSSFGGVFATLKAMVFNTYANPGAKRRLADEARKPHGPLDRLVELGVAADVKQKVGAA